MWPSSVLCCCLRHWNRRQKSKIKQLPDRNEKKEEEEWEHTDTLRQSILLTFSIDFFLLLLFFKREKKREKIENEIGADENEKQSLRCQSVWQMMRRSRKEEEEIKK